MLDLQLSDLDRNGKPNVWEIQSQSFDSLHQSSTVAYEPLEFPETQKLTDEYLEEMQHYNIVTQGNTDFKPPSLVSLSFPSSSPMAWPSLHPNTIEIHTAPMDVPISPTHSQSDIKDARRSSSCRSSKSIILGEDPKKRKNSTRRTLTDENRKEICEYSLLYPNSKQFTIGQHFKVERSTISKILKEKDKYLANRDPVISPEIPNKDKFQKLERTIRKWILKKRNKAQIVTDDEIKKQAIKFAKLTNDPESLAKCEDQSWLAQFSQQNLSRRNSEPNFRANNIPFHSDQAATFNHMANQNDSGSNSNTHTNAELSISTPCIIQPESSSIIPPKSKTSGRTRRRTFPVLETSQTTHRVQDLQNKLYDTSQCSNNSVLIDHRENINDQVISLTHPMKRDYFEFNSPTLSSIKLEDTDDQSLSIDPLPHSLTIEDKALIAFEFLIDHFSKKDKITISPMEYSSFYKLSEKMVLFQAPYPDLPRSF